MKFTKYFEFVDIKLKKDIKKIRIKLKFWEKVLTIKFSSF